MLDSASDKLGGVFPGNAGEFGFVHMTSGNDPFRLPVIQGNWVIVVKSSWGQDCPVFWKLQVNHTSQMEIVKLRQYLLSFNVPNIDVDHLELSIFS